MGFTEVTRQLSLGGHNAKHEHGPRAVRLNGTHVAYPVSSGLCVVDLETGSTRVLPSLYGGGVVAVAAHPNGAFIAVGEPGSGARPPCIRVLSFPGLNTVSTLTGGSEETYSALAFAQAGGSTLASPAPAAASATAAPAAASAAAAARTDASNWGLLSSVGSWPDHTLAVWDGADATMILRTRASGQDVWTLRMAPAADGTLVTGGSGSLISFWRLAKTFTGTKLQGENGRFGRVDASDIESCATVGEGRVLSSSSHGYLLLWEGASVKAQIGRLPPRGAASPATSIRPGSSGAADTAPTVLPAHDGAIRFVDVVWVEAPLKAGTPALTQPQRLAVVVTAGSDGALRWWRADAVEGADAAEGVSAGYTGVLPIGELRLGGGAVPVSVLLMGRGAVRAQMMQEQISPPLNVQWWVIEDSTQALWRVATAVVAVAGEGGAASRAAGGETDGGAVLDALSAPSLTGIEDEDTPRELLEPALLTIVVVSPPQLLQRPHSGRATALLLPPPQRDSATGTTGAQPIVSLGVDGWLRILSQGGSALDSTSAGAAGILEVVEGRFAYPSAGEQPPQQPHHHHSEGKGRGAGPVSSVGPPSSASYLGGTALEPFPDCLCAAGGGTPSPHPHPRAALLTGFDDGTIRVIVVGEQHRLGNTPASPDSSQEIMSATVVAVHKPFSTAVRSISFSEMSSSTAPQGQAGGGMRGLVAVTSAEGEVFLFTVASQAGASAPVLTAMGTVSRPEVAPLASDAPADGEGTQPVRHASSHDEAAAAAATVATASRVSTGDLVPALVHAGWASSSGEAFLLTLDASSGKLGVYGATSMSAFFEAPGRAEQGEALLEGGSEPQLPQPNFTSELVLPGKAFDLSSLIMSADAGSSDAPASPPAPLNLDVASMVVMVRKGPEPVGGDAEAAAGQEGRVPKMNAGEQGADASVATAAPGGELVSAGEPSKTAGAIRTESRGRGAACIVIAGRHGVFSATVPLGALPQQQRSRAAGLELTRVLECSDATVLQAGSMRICAAEWALLAIGHASGLVSILAQEGVPASVGAPVTLTSAPWQLIALSQQHERGGLSAIGSVSMRAATSPPSVTAAGPADAPAPATGPAPPRLLLLTTALDGSVEMSTVVLALEGPSSHAALPAQRSSSTGGGRIIDTASPCPSSCWSFVTPQATEGDLDLLQAGGSGLISSRAHPSIPQQWAQQRRDRVRQGAEGAKSALRNGMQAIRARYAELKGALAARLGSVDAAEKLLRGSPHAVDGDFRASLGAEQEAREERAREEAALAQAEPTAQLRKLLLSLDRDAPAGDDAAAAYIAAARAALVVIRGTRVQSLRDPTFFASSERLAVESPLTPQQQREVERAMQQQREEQQPLGSARRPRSAASSGPRRPSRAAIQLAQIRPSSGSADRAVMALFPAAGGVGAGGGGVLSSRNSASGEVAPESRSGADGSFFTRRALRISRRAAAAAVKSREPGPTDASPGDIEAVRRAAATVGDLRLKAGAAVAECLQGEARGPQQQQQPTQQQLHTVESTLREIGGLQRGLREEVEEHASVLSLLQQRRWAVLGALEASAREMSLLEEHLSLRLLPALDGPGMEEVARLRGQADPQDTATAQMVSAQWLAEMRALQPKPSDAAASAAAGPPLRLGHSATPPLVQARVTLAQATRLMTHMRNLVDAFDLDVATLRNAGLRLQERQLFAALQLGVKAEELGLLSAMQQEGDALQGRLARLSAESSDTTQALELCTAGLEERRARLRECEATGAHISTEFEDITGGPSGALGGALYTGLLRLLRKRVVRPRTRNGGRRDAASPSTAPTPTGGSSPTGGMLEGGYDSDGRCSLDDEEGGGGSLGGFEGDEDAANGAESLAQAQAALRHDGVDAEMVARVAVLRELKQENDEASTAVARDIEDISRSADKVAASLRALEREQAALDGEMAAFHTAQQHRLNRVETHAVLRASQLLMGTDSPTGMLPASLEGRCTLLQRGTMRALKARVPQLAADLRDHEAAFTAMHRDKAALVGRLRERTAAVAAAEARSHDLQLLKYGRLLDVSALDRATVGVAGLAPLMGSGAHGASASASEAQSSGGVGSELQALSRALVVATQALGDRLAAVGASRVRADMLEARLGERHQVATDLAAVHATLAVAAARSPSPPRGAGGCRPEPEAKLRAAGGVANQPGPKLSAIARQQVTTAFRHGVENVMRHWHPPPAAVIGADGRGEGATLAGAASQGGSGHGAGAPKSAQARGKTSGGLGASDVLDLGPLLAEDERLRGRVAALRREIAVLQSK